MSKRLSIPRLLFSCMVQAVVFLFFSFSTVIGTPVAMASGTIILVFLISNGIVKMFLRMMGRRKTRDERMIYYSEVN